MVPVSRPKPPKVGTARGMRAVYKKMGFFKQLGTVREGSGFFWKIELFRKIFINLMDEESFTLQF